MTTQLPTQMGAVTDSAVILSSVQQQKLSKDAGAAFQIWLGKHSDATEEERGTKLQEIHASIERSLKNGAGKSKEELKTIRQTKSAAIAALRTEAHENGVYFSVLRRWNEDGETPLNKGGIVAAYVLMPIPDGSADMEIEFALSICRDDECFDLFQGLQGAYLRLSESIFSDNDDYTLAFSFHPVRDPWTEDMFWGCVPAYMQLLDHRKRQQKWAKEKASMQDGLFIPKNSSVEVLTT